MNNLQVGNSLTGVINFPVSTSINKPKKRKMVKAKVKAKVVNPQIENSIVSCFVYPNKALFEVDSVNIQIGDKVKQFKPFVASDIDIKLLNVAPVIQDLFIGLNGCLSTTATFGYKNAYIRAFGILEKRTGSYKAIVSHHLSDGFNTVVVNQSNQFTIASIKSRLDEGKVNYKSHGEKVYVTLTLTKDNLSNTIKCLSGMLK